MKKIIVAVLSLIAVAVSAPAFAQGKSKASAASAVAAGSPFYAGLQVGDGYIGGFGGYQIDKMYSAEVHYIKVDSISIFGMSTDISSIGVAGVAMFPMTLKGAPPFSLFAKVGVERASAKVKFSAPFPASTTIVTDTSLTLGGGAQYDFNKNVSARLGLDFQGEADSLYISAIFNF